MNRSSLLCLLCILFNLSGVFMHTENHGLFPVHYKPSCLEIKRSVPRALSGLYDILVDDTVITVYCEMAKDGGGYTFISRETVQQGKLTNLVRQIFKDKSRVLLRFQRKDGLQPFTVITQLIQYDGKPLGVLMHNYAGYTRPLNYKLGDYIYLGILPNHVVNVKSYQGFRSNGKDVGFKNCDGNPNAYFAFFPNHREEKISTYHGNNLVYERSGVAVNWRKTGIPSYGHRQVPNNFLFLTEMHFGGCGCYTSSDRWIDSFGTAIGLR